MFYNLRRMIRGENGNVLVLIGVSLFLIVMVIGAAVDMTRAQTLRMRLSSALDAAGLAAAAVANTPGAAYVNGSNIDYNGWVQEEAQRYFTVEFPSGTLGATHVNISAIICNTGTDPTCSNLNTITLQATAMQKPIFMSIFGISNLSVVANSQVTRSSNGQGLELVLAMDNTGSMSDTLSDGTTKITDLQNVAVQLLDTIYGSGDTVSGVYVGVVPFSQEVNINGAYLSNWMDISDPNFGQFDNADTGGSWQGCVFARQLSFDTFDITDAPPSAGAFDRYIWPSGITAVPGYIINQWINTPSPLTYNTPFSNVGNGPSPNYECPQQAIQTMSASKTTVKNAIAGMYPSGDTLLPIGLAWAWRLLSPNWRGWWNSAEMSLHNLPLDYTAQDSVKVVVFLTDGTNHFQSVNYNAYKLLSNFEAIAPIAANVVDEPSAEAYLDTVTLQACDNLRAAGITIYTVGFGNPPSAYPLTAADRLPNSGVVDTQLLAQCAGPAGSAGGITGYSFVASTYTSLTVSFNAIANSIERLRISQ